MGSLVDYGDVCVNATVRIANVGIVCFILYVWSGSRAKVKVWR